MVILCNLQQCPYCKENQCTKPVISMVLTQIGAVCNQCLDRQGQPNQQWMMNHGIDGPREVHEIRDAVEVEEGICECANKC